mmetsp:Transcript_27506/g.73370  ORF Transcript_27506/g.73370 Transcript_27506/m.73370 type:complete len:547 (+) Transcript_27506:83-1723(+)
MPIIRSSIPDVEIDKKSTLTDYVLSRASKFANSQVVDGPSGRAVSYAALLRAIRGTARGLQQAGLGKGEAVAVWMPNSIEYIVAFHAVIMAGGVVTTLNPVYTASEAAHQFSDAQAVYLVTAPAFLEKVEEAVRLKKRPMRRIFVTAEEAPTGYAEFGSLDVGGDPAPVAIDPVRDVCVLPYSSGTTGLSKGTMLTHANIVANLEQLSAPGVFLDGRAPHGPSDTAIAVLPFYHIYGMVVLMNLGMCFGVRIVTVPAFEPGLYLKLLSAYNVTHAYLAPPLALFLAKSPLVDSKDFPHLKDIFSGAAPLGPELTEELRQKFPKACVRQGYGMTELSPVATVDREKAKPGSVGYLVPNMEAKVVDPDTGVEAQPGATGELWLRGPNVMKGYLGNEKATMDTIDSDGFLHTGDICRVDSDGCFFIVDRLKELIKAKGFQVAPAELEALLAAHPEVADVAVIGVPAQKYGGRESDGEVPKAFVIPQPGAKLTPASLAAWLSPQVAEYKRVTEATIQFVEAIPKLPSGKILRKDLRVLEKGLPGSAASKL